MPIRSTNGSRPGRNSSSITAWASLPAGTPGDIAPVNVDGELCVAERGASRWTLRAPSAPAQAYAAAHRMPPVETALLPNSPYRFVGAHMSYSNPALNDGSAWYWPLEGGLPQPGTFSVDVRNEESAPIAAAAALLSSIADPPIPVLALSYFGGSWVVDDAVPEIPAGGGVISGDNTPTPTVVLSDEVALPAGVAGGSAMTFSVVLGSGGYISPTDSITYGNTTMPYTKHPSGEFSDDRFEKGDHRGGAISASFSIGAPMPSHLLLKYPARDFHNWVVFGDSIPAQQRPGVEGSREGFIYEATHAAIAAGSKIRFVSMAQGNAHSSDILNRANALADLVSQYCAVGLVQIPTANEPFANEADADARWAAYLAVKADIEGRTGMVIRAFMPTPPASFSQEAGNLAGYAKIATLIAAEGGVNLAPVLVDGSGTQMSATVATDGAHLTQAGVDLAWPEFLAQTTAIAIALGADV